MKKLLFAAAALLFFAAGCYRYETQFEGPYDDEGGPATPKVAYEIMTVEDGEIHLYHPTLKYNKVLGNLPPGIEKAAVNYSHDRIAYQAPGYDIAIADSTGALLETVPNSANIAWFDWYSNDRTLCLLDGYQLRAWGPAIPIAQENLYFVFPFTASQEYVDCALPTAAGTVVLACRYYDPAFGGYQSRVILADASGEQFYQDLYSIEYVKWMRSNRTGERLILGSQLSSSTNVWEINATFLFNNQNYLNNVPFAAPAPQGPRTAFWSGGVLSIVNNDTGEQLAVSTGGGVTALDW